MVKPWTTMIADLHIEHHVSEVSNALGPAKKEWETSIAAYLAAREIFTPCRWTVKCIWTYPYGSTSISTQAYS